MSRQNQWWLIKFKEGESVSVIAKDKKEAYNTISSELRNLVVSVEPKGNGQSGY